jgi:hypothetical protein
MHPSTRMVTWKNFEIPEIGNYISQHGFARSYKAIHALNCVLKDENVPLEKFREIWSSGIPIKGREKLLTQKFNRLFSENQMTSWGKFVRNDGAQIAGFEQFITL